MGIRESILAADDLKRVVEPVPEWGVDVTFRQLGAEDTMKLTEDMDKEEFKGLGMFLMIIACAVGENDAPLFTREDIPALQKKNFQVLNRLQRAALRVCDMLPEESAALKKD